jgi:maltooligosyltrehalose synthase
MVTLYRRVHAALEARERDNGDWAAVYGFVFSEYQESGLKFTWYDPDTTYEDDVCAFVEELDRLARPYLDAAHIPVDYVDEESWDTASN